MVRATFSTTIEAHTGPTTPRYISELSVVLSCRDDYLPRYLRCNFPTLFGASLGHSDVGRLGTYADCGLGTYTPLFLGSEYSAMSPVLELAQDPIAISKDPLSLVSFLVAQQ